MLEEINKLRLYYYTVEIVTEERLPLNQHLNATIRGGLGYAFKQILCQNPNGNSCDQCELASQCDYPILFENVNDYNNKPFGYPRPFIIKGIEPNGRQGDYYIYHINFVLFGNKNKLLKEFIMAFELFGENGIAYKHKFVVTQVWNKFNSHSKIRIFDPENKIINLDKATPYVFDMMNQSFDQIEKVELKFKVPFRFQKNGKISTDLTFEDLYLLLTKRFRSLMYYFHDIDIDDDIYPHQFAHAIDVDIDSNHLDFKNLKRYSTRQKGQTPLSGLTGSIIFSGPIASYLPLLLIGQFIHVGKQTAFGLGNYEVELI